MSQTIDRVFAEISALYGAADTDDPYPLLAQRRAETPVMVGDMMVALGLAPYGGTEVARPVYSFLRYDDIVTALRDPATYSASIWWESFESLTGRVVMGMDGPEHNRWRRLLMPVFTNRVIDIWRDAIVRPVAARFVDEIRPAGQADLIQYAQRFPVRMIYEIFGFFDDAERYDDFAVDAMTVLMGVGGTGALHDRAVDAAGRLYDGLLPTVQSRRAEGATGTDLICRLINAEFDGERLSDQQVTEFVRQLLPPATETTARMFATTLCLVLERPELLGELREQPELIRSTLVEAERFESPTSVIPRITTREVDVRGVRIPAGSAISLVLASGNRDEEAFDDPDVFDITRKGPHPLAFGFGPHICPGMSTARTESEEALRALLDGLPGLRFDPDRPRPKIVGAHLRGPQALPVVWDEAS